VKAATLADVSSGMQPIGTVLFLLCTLSGMAWSAETVSSGDRDVVILSNRHRLEGTVVAEDRDSLTIETKSGTLVIDRDQVADIDAGFTRRKAALAPGDYQAHLELVRWCLTRNRKNDALDLIARFADSEDLDLEGLRHLARLTDELRSWEEALPLYRRYRDLGGKDPALLARLEQIEQILADYEARLQEVDQQRENVQVAEGLEAKATWLPEDQRWANPVDVQMVSADGIPDKVLQLDYQSADPKKKATVRWRQSLDTRASNRLVMRVNNPAETPVALSIAVKAGGDWTYFESRNQQVPADSNWHRVEFDLGGSDFKSGASDWQHQAAIDKPEDIRELQLQIHNGRLDGTLFINDMGFLGAESGNADGENTSEDVGDDDGDGE